MAADRELIAAAEAGGFRNVYEMPEMILAERAEEPPPPNGVEIRRLSSAEDAEQYWRIAAAAYESVGFPPEVFGHYEGLEDCWRRRARPPSSPRSRGSRSASR